MQEKASNVSTGQSSAFSGSFKRILVAVDGSESAGRAARVALGLAEKFKAQLIVLHALLPLTDYYRTSLASAPGSVSPPAMSQREIDAYRAYEKKLASDILTPIAADARKTGVDVKTVVPETTSSIVETIIQQADMEKVDLIVVGTRGLGGFKKMLLGSVSSGIVSHASGPVLIVR